MLGRALLGVSLVGTWTHHEARMSGELTGWPAAVGSCWAGPSWGTRRLRPGGEGGELAQPCPSLWASGPAFLVLMLSHVASHRCEQHPPATLREGVSSEMGSSIWGGAGGEVGAPPAGGGVRQQESAWEEMCWWGAAHVPGAEWSFLGSATRVLVRTGFRGGGGRAFPSLSMNE